MAINFRGMSDDDLELLLKLVGNSKIQSQIKKELSYRENLKRYVSQSEFRSDRLPDYNPNSVTKCSQLALEFDVERLPHLWSSACFDSWNNDNGDFYIGMFGSDKSELDRKWMHNLGYMSLLFQDEKLRSQYEGTYNTINYLINGIYKELNDRNVETVDEIFSDIDEKKKIVTEKFSDVASYLWSIRSEVLGARSSIGNHGLTTNARKMTDSISKHQEALVEAVAYGCSLGELESENYEGAKRLIYVPNNKIRYL